LKFPTDAFFGKFSAKNFFKKMNEILFLSFFATRRVFGSRGGVFRFGDLFFRGVFFRRHRTKFRGRRLIGNSKRVANFVRAGVANRARLFGHAIFVFFENNFTKIISQFF